jgi:hypothetical protein
MRKFFCLAFFGSTIVEWFNGGVPASIKEWWK